MSQKLSEPLHEALRQSLHQGDFERAGRLGNELGQAIVQEAGSANSPERLVLLRENLTRLEEHLSLARVLRAHLKSRLQTNTALFHYQTDCEAAHCWRFDA
jgi:hypothetical protein